MFNVALAFSNNISSGPSQAQFDAQAAAGLNCQLEYVNSTTVKFSSKSGATISVITPDLKTIDITTSGATATVSGSTSTLYYVYLDSTGISFSTSAASTSYAKMKTLSGTKILIGYMGCSATNTIAGTHNIYSFWNQSQATWTKSVTSASSNYIDTLNGFVIPPGVSASLTYSGTMTISTSYSTYWTNMLNSASITVSNTGSGSNSGYCGWYGGFEISGVPYVSLAVALTDSSFGSGVYNLVSRGISVTKVSQIKTYYTGENYYNECYWSAGNINTTPSQSASGTVTLTRPGN